MICGKIKTYQDNVPFQIKIITKMSDDSPEQENGPVGSPAKKPPSKKLTVEKIYQKKSQLEHILLRPDTYIGLIFQFKLDQIVVWPNRKKITPHIVS